MCHENNSQLLGFRDFLIGEWNPAMFGDKLKCLFKAMSHGAIFHATCDAILLLVNVKNTRLYFTFLMYSSHIKHSTLINNF